VDALLRGDVDEAVRSRAAAFGWAANAATCVVVGQSPDASPESVADAVHRAARHVHLDAVVGVQGDRLVVALDVRDGVVRTRGWTEEGLALDNAVDRCVAAGVPRLLCTAIERDGTLDGPDVELVRRVVEHSRLPVLAAGGIRSDADVDALEQAGAEGAIVGRALLEGLLDLQR